MTLLYDLKNMKCTATEEVIRDYIFDHYLEVLHMTTRELSEKTFTSPTAISRFCKKLGAEGFPQFKLLLVSESQYFQDQLIIDDVLPLKQNDTAFQIVTKMEKIQTQAILQTAKELDFTQVQKLVLLLMETERIHFFGLGINYYIAEEFRYLLGRIGKKVALGENKNDRISQLIDAKKGEVAFVLSHTGKEKEQYEVARLLKEKGVTVVSLTGYPDSPIATLADFHFYIKPGRRFVDMGPIIFSTSTRYVLYTIFGYLFTFCYENKKEEFEIYARLANYETEFLG